MSIENCPRCGALYVNRGRKLCPECIRKEDEAYPIVRDYLNRHVQSSLYHISEETGVDEDTILGLIESGRLRSFEKTLSTRCARCGASVLVVDGQFCQACQRELKTKLISAVRDLSDEDYDRTRRAKAEGQDQPASEPDGEASGRPVGMFTADMRRRQADGDKNKNKNKDR